MFLDLTRVHEESEYQDGEYVRSTYTTTRITHGFGDGQSVTPVMQAADSPDPTRSRIWPDGFGPGKYSFGVAEPYEHIAAALNSIDPSPVKPRGWGREGITV